RLHVRVRPLAGHAQGGAAGGGGDGADTLDAGPGSAAAGRGLAVAGDDGLDGGGRRRGCGDFTDDGVDRAHDRLEAVPFLRVVAGGDDQAPGGPALVHHHADGGRHGDAEVQDIAPAGGEARGGGL